MTPRGVVPVERGGHAEADAARIGPNAVIQTERALRALEGDELLARVRGLAGAPDALPPGLVPEALFVSLVRAVRHALPADRADAVLRRSGAETAAYVAANRVPAPVRLALAVLPRAIAVPVLLDAFARHAWTFAGSGRFRAAGRVIRLDGCPTCRAEAGADGRPSGAYYEAAFGGLLALAAPGAVVRETACRVTGADACRFEISFTAREASCASS